MVDTHAANCGNVVRSPLTTATTPGRCHSGTRMGFDILSISHFTRASLCEAQLVRQSLSEGRAELGNPRLPVLVEHPPDRRAVQLNDRQPPLASALEYAAMTGRHVREERVCDPSAATGADAVRDTAPTAPGRNRPSRFE